MTIEIKDQDGSTTIISIQDEMTIYNVLEQKNTLYPHVKEGHELHIDLSEVSEIDSAGIQLLIFLKHEATRKKNELTYIHHSQAVVEVVDIFNLSSFFNDPVVISAEWSTS